LVISGRVKNWARARYSFRALQRSIAPSPLRRVSRGEVREQIAAKMEGQLQALRSHRFPRGLVIAPGIACTHGHPEQVSGQ